MTNGESCSEVPFAEDADPAYTERAAFESIRYGADHLLIGKCPRCHHPMEFPVVKHLVRGHRERVVVRCCCKVLHPNTPPGRHGCGAGWASWVSQ